jgi:hypothetical protein
MLFNWRKRQLSQQKIKRTFSVQGVTSRRLDFYYSWVMTGSLAIGPIPRNEEDWTQLERDGIRKRFSCCYPEERVFAPIPENWESREVSLPDHRFQEELTPEKLIYALNEATNLLSLDDTPLYLHCFAGQERSALLAAGIVSLIANKDLFDALAYVRQCHPKAKPLYEHLDILERALKSYG